MSTSDHHRRKAKSSALEAVAGMARSGDLEIETPSGEPRRLREADVIASHHRQDRYRTQPLLRQLTDAAIALARQRSGVIEVSTRVRGVGSAMGWAGRGSGRRRRR